MASPYEIALERGGRSGPLGLASSAVREVLEKNEKPGTFEQFFRFLGRPGFAVRSAFSGDFEGVGRNVGQFLNEIFLGGAGAFNPDWTVTGALNLLPGIENLPTDFTDRQHRPEFTDLMKRWGIGDPRYMGFGEKLAFDLVGGALTDPLSLIGGAPKGVTATSLKTAMGPSRRIAMQRAASVGMRLGGGKEVNRLLDVAEQDEILRTAKEFAAPRTKLNWRQGVESAGTRAERDAARASARSEAGNLGVAQERLRSAEEVTGARLDTLERREEFLRGHQVIRDQMVADAQQQEFLLRQQLTGFDPLTDEPLITRAQFDAQRDALYDEVQGQLGYVDGFRRDVTEDARQVADARGMETRAREGLDEIRGRFDSAARAEQAADARLRAFSPGPVSPAKLTVSQALAQHSPKNLQDFVKRAARGEVPGVSAKRASQIVIGIQNRAAENLFFQNSAKAGVDMSRARRTFVPDPANPAKALDHFFDKNSPVALVKLPKHDPRFLNAGPPYPENLVAGVRAGAYKALEIPGQGEVVFFEPRQTILAKSLLDNYQALSDAISLRKPVEDLARIRRDIGMKLGHSDDAIKAELTSLYGEQVANDTVTGLETWKRFLDETPDTILNPGVKALQEKGMIGDGVSYFNPFKGEFNTISWGSIFGATLPGLVFKALKTYAPSKAGQIEDWVSATVGLVTNRIFSRFSPTQGVDAGFGAHTRGVIYKSFSESAKHRDTTIRTFIEKLTPDERGEMARQIDIMGDRYQQAIVAGEHLAPDIQAEARRRLEALQGVPATGAPARNVGPVHMRPTAGGERVVTGLRGRGPQTTPEMLRQMSEKILSERYMETLKAEMGAVMPNPSVLEALDVWRKGMSQIPPYMRYGAKWEKDLKDFSPSARAAWDDALENPFYLPHQMSPRLHQLLDEGIFDNVAAGAINDVFSGTRDYRTRKEFLEVLEGLADRVGLELDDGLEKVQQLDLAELYYRRMVSFELTKARQELYQQAARTMKAKGGTASDYTFYINRVLHPTADLDWATGEVKPGGGARKSFFGRLLGGGNFTVPFQRVESAQKWAKMLEGFGAKVVSKDGNFGLRFRWPGFNSVYKPLLTSHPLNPKFRFRNILSSALMLQFVPGIGPEGFKQIVPALAEDGAVRLLMGFYEKPPTSVKDGAARLLTGQTTSPGYLNPAKISKGDYVAAGLRFLLGNTQAERDAAYEFLRRSGTTVGPYSWEQAAPALRMVMGASGGISTGDLSSGAEMVAKLTQDTASLSIATRADMAKIGQVRQGWRDYVAHGERLSNEVEARFRATLMLSLLGKGVDPYEAAKRVGDALVDYSKQSVVERAIRDVFPFARFMIGSTAWGKHMLEKPGASLPAVMMGLSPVSASLITPQTISGAQRSLSSQTEGEAGGGAFLPGEAAGTIAMPLPWRDREGNIQFLTSLGLPHEAIIQIVGAATGDSRALQKNVLGSLQPLVRLPVEAITGRSFYFGTDFGSYRKAPYGEINPFADTIPGRDGRPDQHEISGKFNELLGALPTAGFQSMTEKWFDSRREWWNKAMVTATGFKITSADLDREVKRRVAGYLKDKVESGQIGEVQAFFTRMDPEEMPEDLKIMLQALAQERAASRKKNSEQKGRGLGY